MTLPDPEVLALLRRDFVVGWRSNEREEYTGSSLGYHRRQTAVGTTNGAGAHNVQILVLSPDLVVLHALPGFWHPDDFEAELRFALAANLLWQDPERTLQQKRDMLVRLHRVALREPAELTTARSDWQSFDRAEELARVQAGETRDTVEPGLAGPRLKPINVLVHERMAQRPFQRLADFDLAAFVDYGREHYDNNAGVDDGGRRFRVAEALKAQRARKQAREGKRAGWAAAK